MHRRFSFMVVLVLVAGAALLPRPARAELGLLATGTDRIAYGASVEIPDGETIHDAIAYGGTVQIGTGVVVTGDVIAMGGRVEVGAGSEVRGDVVSLGGSVVIGPGVVVDGDVSSLGGSVDIDPSAEILGSQVGSAGRRAVQAHSGRPLKVGEPTDKPSEEAGVFSELLSTTARYLCVLVLAFVLLVASPKRVDRMRRPLHDRPGKALLAGLLLPLAMLPVIVLLVMTGIGIVFLPVLAIAYLLVVLLGWTVISLRVGRHLSPAGKRTPARELFLGLLVFWGLGLLAELPFIGFIASLLLFLATLAGTGAVLLSRFGERPTHSGGAELWPPPEEVSPGAEL